MSAGQYGAGCDDHCEGAVQVIIVPSSRQSLCSLSRNKQPVPSPGPAQHRRSICAHKYKMTQCCGTSCSRAQRQCVPEGWNAWDDERDQMHKGAACTTRKHQVCEEHAEHRLQAAQRELYDAQARIQRYGRDTDTVERRMAQAEEHHSHQISSMQERLDTEASERACIKSNMEQLLDRMQTWRERLQGELDQERHALCNVKLQLASSTEKAQQLQALLKESRKENVASKADRLTSDALCKQLREKLEAAQLASAAEQDGLQEECEIIRAELECSRVEHDVLQKHAKQLTNTLQETIAEGRRKGERLIDAEQDLQDLHEECERLTERADKAEGRMLEASRRADEAERQLQRRQSEAGHLAQKQSATEQALSTLEEQHAQAAAAAAARQLVMQTQEVDLKAAKAKVAQAQQLEKDLQEARRQVTVIAEDDEDLRDKVHMLTEALNLATQRLAAAGVEQQHYSQGELQVAKILHAAAAEVEVLRGAVHRAEVRASSCEAQESRLHFCLIEAQAEVANSRGRLAEISDSHSAELAARAQMAAQQDSTLSDERAAKAKLSAQVSELKASLVSMEERATAVAGDRERAEAESALANSALAACKRQLSNAWAENISLVGAFEHTMQGHTEHTYTAPPD